MKTIIGIYKLTRINENIGIPITHTLLALLPVLKLGQYQTDILLNILMANTLAVISTFMINDIKDCEKDKVSNTKKIRNPISAGIVSAKLGLVVAIIVALASLVIYLKINLMTFLLGVTIIAIGWLYSIYWKSKPPFDVISHIYFLGTGLTLVVFTAFNVPVSRTYILPLFISSIISFIVQLNNQIRDFDDDKKAGTNTFVYQASIKTSLLIRKMAIIITAACIFLYIFIYRNAVTFLLNKIIH